VRDADPAADIDAGHFDRIADRYDDARPPYPAALWALLEDAGVVHPGARVLELGAGSGQATRELVARGAVVDAVEPGSALAAELRAAVPGTAVHHQRAEDLVLPAGSHDVAVAATAWHWLDQAAVLPVLHHALRPGGLLAVWWNVFGDPAVPTAFRERVQTISEEAGLARRGPIDALRTDERCAELAHGGLFVPREPVVLRWQVDLTPSRLGALFGSFPTWARTAGAVERIVAAAQECGPVVTEHYLTAVYVADRG
jgi:SAM-dependent methyltransferase